MQFTKSFHVVDSHTMGEATRIIIGGVNTPGKTMAEKMHNLQTENDEMRRALMLEPRGHDDMFGAILTQPVNPEADFGIIFMDGGGYLNMCGHGTIGATTVVLETGMKSSNSPEEVVVFETPAGLVRARAQIRNHKVKSVTFQNVPAFVERQGIQLQVPDVGQVLVDISFGGSFFAIVSAESLGVPVDRRFSRDLIERSMKVRKALNESIKVQHPLLAHIQTIDLVEVYDNPSHPEAHLKNAVVFGNGQVDRSPCGTGTCAKMALLHREGKLAIGQPFVYESILGTLFTGRLTEETMVGEYQAVTPEITGSAFITGFNHYVIDPDDPLKCGFSLRPT